MNNATTILLVRHGETEWNCANRLQGNKNSPLTDKGIKQAENTCKLLENIKIDSVYSSPLERAYKTAEIIIKKRGLSISVKNNLREINLGPWEGKTKEETEISDPSEYKNFWDYPEYFALEGAETYSHLQNRIIEEINSILTQNTGKTVLAVSHWIAIKTAAAYYKGLDLSSLNNSVDLSNGGIIVLKKINNNITVSDTINNI